MSDNDENNPRAKMVKSPWFQGIYANALKFYKRDEVLDANDRLELYNIYSSIRNHQLVGGWLGFGALASTPFLFKYYNHGTFKGVSLPRSVVLGFIGMVAASHFASEYSYKRAIKKLDPNDIFRSRNTYDNDDENPDNTIVFDDSSKNKTNKERQYEMLTLLQIGSPTMWSNYFYMTYKNPNKRFPDPSQKLQEFKEGKEKQGSFLNRRDPFQLYSGPKKEKGEGVIKNNPSSDTDTEMFSQKNNDTFNPGTSYNKQKHLENLGNSSSWDRVRENANKNENADPNDSSGSIFGFDEEVLPIKDKDN